MNLLDFNVRKAILEDIESNDNKARRGMSFKQQEVYNDRLKQYVHEWLLGQFSQKTVDEMPVISCLNIYKRIVDQVATIYQEAPDREFNEVSDAQREVLTDIYKDSKFDTMFKRANKLLVEPRQCAVQIIPKNNKFFMRVLRPHNYSVIPDPENPEEAFAYIIHGFDKYKWQDFSIDGTATGYEGESSLHELEDDNRNEDIADKEDYKVTLDRHVVWTRDLNFIMNGKGEIIDPDTGAPYKKKPKEEDLESPLKSEGVMPIFDLFSGEKDGEFFIRSGESLFDFTVQFNGSFSDLAQIVRMQGWSQAYMKGPKDKLPENMTIGPTKVLYLEVDENNPDVPIEFDFVSPQADIEGAKGFLETFLYTFISSRGIDPKTISTKGDSTSYSSALEKMLSMIEKMQASKDDYEKMLELENWTFDILKAWSNVAEDQLDKKYRLGQLPEGSSVAVDYVKPENVQTENEELEGIEKEIDMGIKSRIEAIMQRRNVDRERAVEILNQIEDDGGIELADQEE